MVGVPPYQGAVVPPIRRVCRCAGGREWAVPVLLGVMLCRWVLSRAGGWATMLPCHCAAVLVGVLLMGCRRTVDKPPY